MSDVYSNKDNCGKGTPISIRRAFGIAVPLCLTALLLAGAVISIANDVYAFVKPDSEIVLTLNQPPDAEELAKLLQAHGVINNAFAFKYYTVSHGLSDRLEGLSGELTLNSNMSYRELTAEISKKIKNGE